MWVLTPVGCFWLTYGGVLQPFYSAYGNYAQPGQPAASGMSQPPFVNSFGTNQRVLLCHKTLTLQAFFLLFMGVLCLIYLICALRTNLILVFILLPLPGAFSCLAGAFWYLGQGRMALAMTLQTAGGALAFVTSMFGWYLFAALMLSTVDAPIQLPGKFRSPNLSCYISADHAISLRSVHQNPRRQ